MSSGYVPNVTSPGADEGGCGDVSITAIHPDIIQSHILRKLDGPTLASTSCTASELLSLCSDDQLWKDVCESTWPSTDDPLVREVISTFPSGYKSFYSDSYPTIRHHNVDRAMRETAEARELYTSELISAVDIFYDGNLIYSKVLESQTTSSWFQNSPFQEELLGPKEMIVLPIKYDEIVTRMALAEKGLRVSWILIDPIKKRAVNVASREPVEVLAHWLTEDIKLRYTTVVAAGDGEMVQCSVVITCSGREGGDLHVTMVSMQVEDKEGKTISGRDSLVILNEAMKGQRSKIDNKLDKEMYKMFLRLKVENKEREIEKERNLDMAFVVSGIFIFFAIWVIFMWR